MNANVLSLGLAIALSAPAVHAGPENVDAPGNYRQEMIQYYSGDRTANEKQAIRIYANTKAVEGKQADGKLPYGSVLVGEIYTVKADASGATMTSTLGRRIPDKLAAVVVMERGQGFDSGYPDELKTGDWEFAVFSPDGKRLDKPVADCRACHHPLAGQEFVFSYQHLGH